VNYLKKIAIAADSGYVSAHFGRCPEFIFVSIDNNQVVEQKTLSNPGHAVGTIPRFIHENNASAILCGGMGARAQQMFSEYGIDTIMGIQMSVEDAIQQFAKGSLVAAPSLCSPQSGRGYGIPRSDGHEH
jgi:predicted Fe-Mo cluster-binding NifX family protein